jgi:hypothetical protein
VKKRRRVRPTIPAEIRRLIERMVAANPLWRAPRIHGELKMLGIEISERTVSGASSSRGAGLRGDRASLRSLDVPADCRSLRQSESAPVSPARSRPHLRQRSSFADRITADGRSAHGAPESVAESVRRTADRLDPKRVPGPFRDPQREASQANSELLFRLLPRIEDAFRTGQAMSTCKAGLECRKDRQDSAPRRRNAMPADAFLANDKRPKRSRCQRRTVSG